MAYAHYALGVFLCFYTATPLLAQTEQETAPQEQQEQAQEEVINDTETVANDADTLAEIIANETAVNEVQDTQDAESRYHAALRELLQTGYAFTPEQLNLGTQTTEQQWIPALRLRSMLGELQVHSDLRTKLQLAGLEFDIPLMSHPLVDSYIDYFSGRGRWLFERWLSRGARYIPIMQDILVSKGIPKDVVYLAMIESGFNSKAYSTAAASGFWQFIQSTGKDYGLRNDIWVDERRDFILATEAAARYLQNLYKEFGDWHLAFAGYNAGSGRISRALKKYDANSYWDLLNYSNSIAKETQHYVPKLIAAALIAKEPERYGFSEIASLKPLDFDVIKVNEAVDLNKVAQKFGYDVDFLRDLNPALKHGITPPSCTFPLRVPKGEGDRVASWLDDLPATERLAYTVHKVRKGESLATLARRYKTSVNAICDFNKIPNVKLRAGKQLVIPAGASFASEVKTTQVAYVKPKPSSAATKSAIKSAAKSKHIVHKGDTLSAIADRYGTSVQKIKSLNKKRSNKVSVGEALIIR